VKMVVPGSAPVIQPDHDLEPDLGRGSTENSAMGPDADSTDQVGPELEEVRKLQELVRRLEVQNQQLRTRSRKSVLGANTRSQIHASVGNHNSGLNGTEINNSINTLTEKQELQIMADLHSKLSKIRAEVEENDKYLENDVDTDIQYSCKTTTGKTSPNSKLMSDTEMQTDIVNVSCLSILDSSSTELVEELFTAGIYPSTKISEYNQSDESQDLGNLLNNTALDEVEVLELGSYSDEEDSWLYVSPRKSTADLKMESPLEWCRQVLDHPSPETEVACRTLINRLDQASRWKNLYCSPLASPSAHNLNTETGSCSNALNSPGHLKSTNKPLLTCGSSGYLSMHSALSSQSSVDSELSTSDDSISMGYKLQDLTDVQVMARLQEESLRQDCASSSASVSRRSSSASLHSLRRGTYSDQEFDTYSLEDEDDYDCSLSSYRSTHRYSPSPLSSPRCQSPSSGADYGRATTSRIRPPRRAMQSNMQDRLKYSSNEDELRHSMPNLARTSLRSLESVRNSRSLESDLQVPSSRLSRIQQPSSLAPSKLRYSSSASQSPLTVRQPMKAGSCTNSLTPRQPVKASSYVSPAGGLRKPQSSTFSPGSSNSSCSATRSNSMASGAKISPLKVRTSVGGTSTPKSKLTQPSKR
uniref:SLAIN motif-containing protein-like n=1 Tax=Sphenodon punctatus TaxID=8508 RepID=A0A8D0GIS4_SPHPU